MTVLISLGRTLTRTTTVGLRLRQRKVLSAHSIWREEREESQRVKREQTEQGESYAVISMVCAAVCSGLVELAPSGSVLVALRLRMPSVEPTLEAEWVLERTSRVIPAVGTVGRQREVCVDSDRNHQCGAVSDVCVCVLVVGQLIVQPASADLNRPHCDRAAGFKSDDSESETPFTPQLQICSAQCENLFQHLREQNAKTVKLRRQIWI